MTIKHQTDCFRNIKGVRYTNYMDLIQGEDLNQKGIEEAKRTFRKVKIIPHWSKEYSQLFVAEEIK